MADTKDGPELHPQTVELARWANYGSITTVLPSGNFQTQLIQVHTDGERLVVNTEVHRQKFKNVQRDPRVTLTIRNEQDPYHYAAPRGRVVETVTGPEARERIDQLPQKYYGQASLSAFRRNICGGSRGWAGWPRGSDRLARWQGGASFTAGADAGI